MRAGANPDPLFFATHRHMRDLFIFVQEIDELKHIDVWNTGYQVDARFFQAGENLSRSLKGSHFTFPCRRFSLPVSSRYERSKITKSKADILPRQRDQHGPNLRAAASRTGRKTFRRKVSGFFLADRFLLC